MMTIIFGIISAVIGIIGLLIKVRSARVAAGKPTFHLLKNDKGKHWY